MVFTLQQHLTRVTACLHHTRLTPLVSDPRIVPAAERKILTSRCVCENKLFSCHARPICNKCMERLYSPANPLTLMGCCLHASGNKAVIMGCMGTDRRGLCQVLQ